MHETVKTFSSTEHPSHCDLFIESLLWLFNEVIDKKEPHHLVHTWREQDIYTLALFATGDPKGFTKSDVALLLTGGVKETPVADITRIMGVCFEPAMIPLLEFNLDHTLPDGRWFVSQPGAKGIYYVHPNYQVYIGMGGS